MPFQMGSGPLGHGFMAPWAWFQAAEADEASSKEPQVGRWNGGLTLGLLLGIS